MQFLFLSFLVLGFECSSFGKRKSHVKCLAKKPKLDTRPSTQGIVDSFKLKKNQKKMRTGMEPRSFKRNQSKRGIKVKENHTQDKTGENFQKLLSTNGIDSKKYPVVVLERITETNNFNDYLQTSSLKKCRNANKTDICTKSDKNSLFHSYQPNNDKTKQKRALDLHINDKNFLLFTKPGIKKTDKILFKQTNIVNPEKKICSQTTDPIKKQILIKIFKEKKI